MGWAGLSWDRLSKADLGWAEWRTKGAAKNDTEPADEYLRLALTFEPAHTRALEYHARIAMDTGNKDEAIARLKRILKADSSANWARQAIAGIESPDGPDSGNKGGRFWKRGGGQ